MRCQTHSECLKRQMRWCPRGPFVPANHPLANVIAWLHVRGEGNDALTKGLRDPVEEDAELALHALGFALRDIGWAA
jgi:hypothetical protein